MRIVSWNMKRKKGDIWDFLINNLNPDIALLQETSRISDEVEPKNILEVIVKRNLRNSIYSSSYEIQRIRMPKEINTDFICGKLARENSEDIFLISVYGNLALSPFFTTLTGKLTLIMTYLRTSFSAKNIIIAGDFNSDRRMDDNPTGTRFARTGERVTNLFFDSILNFGFSDCIRKFHPTYLQTYRHNLGDYPWELDHMFATKDLYEKLTKFEVLDDPIIHNLSDHNPIVAEFNV